MANSIKIAVVSMLASFVEAFSNAEEALAANFLIAEIDDKFVVLPSPEAQVVFCQLPSGGWYVQPLPEEGWTAQVWWWNESPMEITLTDSSWQPVAEGEERKLPAEAAKIGWSWVLSSRGTR